MAGSLVSWSAGWFVARDCSKSGRLPSVAVAGRVKSHGALGSTGHNNRS